MPAAKSSASKTTGRTKQGSVAKSSSSKSKKSERGITKGSIRRIARRGGCRRLAATVYQEANNIITSFVQNVMADTAALLEMTGRKTVRPADILFSLKKQGRTLYAVA